MVIYVGGVEIPGRLAVGLVAAIVVFISLVVGVSPVALFR